jgi:hypothetical protein
LKKLSIKPHHVHVYFVIFISLVCHPFCSECFGPLQTDCLSCSSIDNLLFSDNSCDCETSFYQSSSPSEHCESCSEDCLSCNSESSCILCNENFTLNDGICSYTCSSNCLSCSSSSICNICSPEYFLFLESCIDSCPYPFFPSENTCKEAFYISSQKPKPRTWWISFLSISITLLLLFFPIFLLKKRFWPHQKRIRVFSTDMNESHPSEIALVEDKSTIDHSTLNPIPS